MQQQAMDIWEQASGLRRLGKVPSIADFEKLLVTAKLQKASIAAVAAKVSPEDMSVRCVATPQPRVRSLTPCFCAGPAKRQVRAKAADHGGPRGAQLTSTAWCVCRMGGNAQGLPKRTAPLFGSDSDVSSSGADANPSVRFGNAVAASAEEFGERFGHYGRQASACSQGWRGASHAPTPFS